MSKKNNNAPTSFTIPVSSPSRLRIGEAHALRILSDKKAKSIAFIGFFRGEQELVCCADVGFADDQHPLNSILNQVPEDDGRPIALDELPAARQLVLNDRIVEFSATWTPAGNQLDLNLGAAILRQLGFDKNIKNQIHAVIFGGLLVLMSPTFFRAVSAVDMNQ